MANNPYSAVGPFQFKQYDERGQITPNFEFSEGQRPAGEFMPAPYLPAIRFNKYFEEFFVVSGGKVVALSSDGFVVPAGLKKEAAAYKAEFDVNGEAAADAAATIVYAQTDAQRGVQNAKGVAVVPGEPVVKSFFDTVTGAPLTATTTISNPVGLAMYNYWSHPGGNGENPVDFNRYNFNLQNKVVFLCDYQVEMPIVEDKATYDAAPFAGMGAMVSAAGSVKPGMFVTYDVDSNFVLSADDGGYAYGATTPVCEVLGQVLSTDLREVRDLLNLVRTRSNDFGELEKMPGTATGGKSDTLTYSGGYGLVRINLQLR
jgi:hypothetical protein